MKITNPVSTLQRREFLKLAAPWGRTRTGRGAAVYGG